MKIRQATEGDVDGITSLLQELTALGKRTNRSDPEFVRTGYIEASDNVQCVVAEDADGTILGFQVLKIAAEGNIYGVAVGWGYVGTHMRPSAARRGIGRSLFEVTSKAAKDAGLQKIDATIGEANAEGLGYYDAMGFQTYRTPAGKICKCYDVSSG